MYLAPHQIAILGHRKHAHYRPFSLYACNTADGRHERASSGREEESKQTPVWHVAHVYVFAADECFIRYLSGNFAPIQQTCILTPCKYTGEIPSELLGGEYVRNGGNPVTNEDLGRDAHWFDGDGMLSGVSFRRNGERDGMVQPEFVNQYILTDVFLSTISTPSLRKPILPSIATLVNPLSSLIKICLAIFRALFLVVLSWLPGSDRVIKKISVANTSILFHDGRALATCESGPPLRVALPGLETVGWYNGKRAEGEPTEDSVQGAGFGGEGIIGFMKEWTTAHPKVDPVTNEMMLFHSTFIPPFIHYSIVPATKNLPIKMEHPRPLLNAAVPGVASAKMMHDFGVSHQHTVIMDLPLSLDPLKLARNKPPIEYDSSKPSRFGVFPRAEPSKVRWFETSACCIFHTANTWDIVDDNGNLQGVDMLTCRQTSSTLVFSAGNIAAPQPTKATARRVTSSLKRRSPSSQRSNSIVFEQLPSLESPTMECGDFQWSSNTASNDNEQDHDEEDQCRLYYYSFNMSSAPPQNKITHQWALSSISFEFPSVHPALEMSAARYIYGCTTCESSFNAALGRAVKIDGLVKFDVQTLIARGKANPPLAVTGCVDTRSALEIMSSQTRTSTDVIKIFRPPAGVFAQEPRFVPSAASGAAEDAGYLLSYMFDEAQLTADGEPPSFAVSELWIIDARNMTDVLAKVHLPQRVPYGLHGTWFSEQQVLNQRPIESVRRIKNDAEREKEHSKSLKQRVGRRVIRNLVAAVGG